MNPGGSFDLLARVLARHMPKYIPGKPSIIVQNMPGAGYLMATNYVYTMPGDGLTIVASHGAVINRHVAGIRRSEFDPKRFVWLGQVGGGAVPRLFSVRPQIASTLDQFLRVQAERPVHVGTVGPGTTLHEFARFLAVIGLNVNLVAYKSGPEIWAALERGEVDAISAAADTLPDRYRHFYEDKVVVRLSDNQDLKTFAGVVASRV